MHRKSLVWSGLVVGIFLGAARTVHAASTEQRDYQVIVEGKEVGQSHITITRQDDGTTVMTGQASVQIKVVFMFQFSNQITEWWKDGRLVGLKASTTENKRRTDLTVSSDNNRLRLLVNNRERSLHPQVWPNSFWKLPDPKYHNKQVPILEVDTGREHVGLLTYLGTKQLTVGGQSEKCYHFRVTGGPNTVDLWFDQYYVLVRQEFVEQGHRTVIQAMNIRR